MGHRWPGLNALTTAPKSRTITSMIAAQSALGGNPTPSGASQSIKRSGHRMKLKSHYAPVVALDIDGTLGDYHGHFLRFAQGWYGRRMPDATEINPGLPLHKFMRTSKATYRQCKLAYRQGGLERSMPAYPGASELTVQLRRRGCEVWITTTRPYLKHDTQSPNTVHWLRRNGIQWDHMISGEHKYRDLVKQVGKERIVAVLDDLPEMIEQANGLGLWTMIRDQPYNRHFTWHYRAHDLFEAQRTIAQEVNSGLRRLQAR